MFYSNASRFLHFGSSLSAYSKDARFGSCLEVRFALQSCLRIYAPEISLLSVALMPTSEGSCLYSMKVQNALQSFLIAPRDFLSLPTLVLAAEIPEFPEWVSSKQSLLLSGCLPCTATSPAVPSGFYILLPSTQ